MIKKSSLLTEAGRRGIGPSPGKTEKAEEKIKQINEAYEVLSDKEKREKYDRLGANWRAGEDFYPPPDMGDFHFYTGTDTTGSGFSDFFEAIFGGGFGRRARASRQRGAVRGQDVEYELELTLEEAYRGGEKTLQVSSKEVSCLRRDRV